MNVNTLRISQEFHIIQGDYMDLIEQETKRLCKKYNAKDIDDVLRIQEGMLNEASNDE